MDSEKIDRSSKKTLNKINKLYKWLYGRTLRNNNDTWAYLELQDDIKEAYKKFKQSVSKQM